MRNGKSQRARREPQRLDIAMEHFEHHGVWWLPESDHHQVPGVLTSSGEGLELTVFGELEPLPTDSVINLAPQWIVRPLALGKLRDGRLVTLLELGGANVSIPHTENTEYYRISFVLIGCHAHDDEFTSSRFTFDVLDAWADPPAIHVPTPGEEASIELARTDVPGAAVTLTSRCVGTAGDSSIHLDRLTNFEIDLTTPLSAGAVRNDYIKPLGDLLAVALGRVARITGWYLLPKESSEDSGWAQVFFEAIQPTTGPSTIQLADLLHFSAPTLLTASAPGMPLPELLQQWFAVWHNYREAIVLLLGPYYAPFIYSEHRFSSLFQAAEAFHKKDPDFSSKDVPRPVHKQRLNAIRSALVAAGVAQDDVAWALRVLESRNDKPLRRIIDELVDALGAIGTLVRNASPQIGTVVTGGRTGVSHGGANKKLDRVSRHWYGEALRYIVRAHLLLKVGIPLPEVERRVASREAFRNALDRIREYETGAGD